MASLSDILGQSKDIPSGDKIRLGTKTALPTDTLTTILSVASGGGLLQSIVFGGTADWTLTNIKVTIDGAAERTLDYNGTQMVATTGTPGTKVNMIELSLGIQFTTSLTVKVTSTNVGATAIALYTIN